MLWLDWALLVDGGCCITCWWVWAAACCGSRVELACVLGCAEEGWAALDAARGEVGGSWKVLLLGLGPWLLLLPRVAARRLSPGPTYPSPAAPSSASRSARVLGLSLPPLSSWLVLAAERRTRG